MRPRTLVVAGLFLLLVSCGSENQRLSSGAVTTTAPTTATTAAGRVVDLSGAGLSPNTIVTDGQSVWVAGAGSPEGGRVARIDPETGAVLWSVNVPDDVVGLARDPASGVLWATGGGDGADPDGGITRLQGESGKLLGTLEVPGGTPYGVAVGPAAVWVTDASGDRVWKIDLTTGSIAATIRVARYPVGIAYEDAANTVWVASPDAGLVTRLDGTTGAVRGTVPVTTANSVVATSGAVWVGGDSFVRLDHVIGDRVATIPTRGVTRVVGLTEGWVWGKEVAGPIVRADVAGGRLESRPVAVGDFAAVALAGDVVWIYEPDAGRLVEKWLPLVSALDFPVERPRDGDTVGYIRAFDGEKLTFDPIEALVEPEATTAAVLDGAGITVPEGLPNGYYDRNRDGRTYEIPLAADASLAVLTFTGEVTSTDVDRSTFRRALAATDGSEFFGSPGHAPFRVTIEFGQVVRAEQLYRP